MTRTFTEMMHGDMLAMKQQEIAMRMHRKGETEMVVLDAEAGVSYMTSSHYAAHDLLVDAVKTGMGFGKGIQAKRKMVADRKVVAEINRRHPALAAEQRVGGKRDKYSFSFKTLSMREWQKLNYAYYYGMGELWKV